MFCSEGTIENSPAFQCRVSVEMVSSPAGTGETPFQSSLRDSYAVALNPGVETPGYFQSSLRDEVWRLMPRAGMNLMDLR